MESKHWRLFSRIPNFRPYLANFLTHAHDYKVIVHEPLLHSRFYMIFVASCLCQGLPFDQVPKSSSDLNSMKSFSSSIAPYTAGIWKLNANRPKYVPADA